MPINSHTKNKPVVQPSFGNTLNNTPQAFLSMETQEIWKDVVGYEGHYKVSSLGRVRSEGKLGINPYGAVFIYKTTILSPQTRMGYLRGILSQFKYIIK